MTEHIDKKHIEVALKRKEEIEVRNSADSMIYNAEKTLKELGDKVSADEKSKIESEIDNVKNALNTNDSTKIKEATEKLTQAFYDISTKIYQQAGAGVQGDPTQNAGNSQNNGTKENVFDADYKVVDDDK
jgi:molecular chaperone DnaK